MKTLLIKGGLLAALVLGLMLAVFLLPFPYNHDLAAILNKRDLLKQELPDRIIFVGGSGLYSALDSGMVQERLGRPVVNMGLYAGFGVTALLREIRPYLHAGDAVVIVPEYGVVYDRHLDDSRKWIFALGPSRNILPLYGTAPNPLKAFAVDFIGLVRYKFEAFPQALREALRTGRLSAFMTEGYVRYREYFDAYGDSYRIFPAASSPDTIKQRGEDYFSVDDFRNQSLTAVNDFCRDEARQGVRTFFAFPAYPEEEYRRFHDGLRRYEQRLRKELACPILGRPEDFFYPYRMFTDTIHHLGVEGRRKRTETVIALLEKQPMMAHRPRGGTAGLAAGSSR
jgi:hypothetical protein